MSRMSQWTCLACLALLATVARADEPGSAAPPAPGKPAPGKPAPDTKVKSRPPLPLNKQKTVLLDRDGKRVLLKAKVCARDRVLEMLCCLKQTKEHESILTLNATAVTVHAGLLAAGAKPGRPVRYVRQTADGKFVNDFHPPEGQRIDIFLQWTDAKGRRHRVRAEQWVRRATRRYFSMPLKALPDGVVLPKEPELIFDSRNHELVSFGQMLPRHRDVFLGLSKDKAYTTAVRGLFKASQPVPMRAHWVFAGSAFAVNKKTKEKFYLAENGCLICVANFAAATLDISVPSSKEGPNLLYEAYTERIPPVDTDVLIELIPVSSPVGQDAPPPPPLPRRLSR